LIFVSGEIFDSSQKSAIAGLFVDDGGFRVTVGTAVVVIFFFDFRTRLVFVDDGGT
jgi:hypothetical protein